MTKKFCDKCGEENTHNQFSVFHPDVYAHAGKPMQLDVCNGCQKKVIDMFNKFFGRKTTADFKR